jgi:hypothetical protein
MKRLTALAALVAMLAPFAALVASPTASAAPQQASPRQLVLSFNWTPSQSDSRFPILRYEYTTDNGATWAAAPSTGTDAQGQPTYANPMQVTTASNGNSISRGVRYQVRLRSVNALGVSPPSNILATTIAPAAPTLTVTRNGSTMDLSWTQSAGASSYEVFQDDTRVSTTTQRSLSRSGTQGTSYSFYVEAVNDGGTSRSNTVTVTIPVPPPPPPAAPGWASVGASLGWPNDGVSDNVNASASWASVTGANYYYYLFYEGWSLVGWGTTTNTSVSVSGRPHGNYYQVQVAACSDSNGCGEWAQSGYAWSRHISWPVRQGIASNSPGHATWVDTWTGRRAYYGSGSEPGGLASGSNSCASGLTWTSSGYTMADGTAVKWRWTHRSGWCAINEDRFVLDWGSEPAYASWTNRHSSWTYPSSG